MERHVSPKAWAKHSKMLMGIRGARRSGQGEDHFLLVTSLRVRDFRVNAFIPSRRRRNNALMLAWGCGPLLFIGSRQVFALRDGLLNRIVRFTA